VDAMRRKAAQAQRQSNLRHSKVMMSDIMILFKICQLVKRGFERRKSNAWQEGETPAAPLLSDPYEDAFVFSVMGNIGYNSTSQLHFKLGFELPSLDVRFRHIPPF